MKKILIFFFLLISNLCFAYKQIEIVNIKKYASYVEVTVTMRFSVPASLISGGKALNNASQIISTYGNYTVDSIDVTPFVVVTHTETFSIIPSTLAAFKASLVNQYNTINTYLNSIAIKPYDTFIGAYYDGSSWTTP